MENPLGRVSGKVALVTGGAGGIGEACCRALVREGASVVIADLNGPAAEALAFELGASVRPFTLDVTSEEQCDRAVSFAVEQFGGLDILVNNAGGGKLGPSHEETWLRWRATLDVNLDGVFLMARAAIRQMLSGGGGSIVNMASVHGHVGFAQHVAYTSAKGGVVNMTRALGVEFAARNIRVNAVCPGFVNTRLIATEVKPEDLPPMIALHPIGRMAEPSEIASAVLFLASDESSFVVGANLMVDGGYSAQ